MSVQRDGDPFRSGVAPSITPRRLRLSFPDSLKTGSDTPESSASPKSTRSQIAPSRFQNLAQYWHQRVAGSEVAQLASSSKSECASTRVASSSEPSASSREDVYSDLRNCKIDQKTSPEDGFRFRPTPRRLCNLLESSPFSPGVCEGARDRDPRLSPRESVYTTPGTNATLRTPERPSPGTGLSSNTSIMSIATPVKRDQSHHVAETEMELALDLVNHLPPRMMNRLIDVWQTSDIEREHTHDGGNDARPEKLAQSPRRCASIVCKQLLWRLCSLLALLIAVSFVFVAGFMTHMVWDTCVKSSTTDSEKMSVTVPFTLDRLGSQSLCAWVQSISVVSVQLHSYLGNHEFQRGLFGSHDQPNFQVIGAKPFLCSDHLFAVPELPAYSIEGCITNSSSVPMAPWRNPERGDVVPSVDYSQIQMSFETQITTSLESMNSLKATTLPAGNFPGVDLRDGHDTRMKADDDIHSRLPPRDTVLKTLRLDGGIEKALRMESERDSGVGDWHFNADLFVFEYRGDVRQSCLNAAASWRESGASVNVPEGDLYAENACNAAASPKDGAGSTNLL